MFLAVEQEELHARQLALESFTKLLAQPHILLIGRTPGSAVVNDIVGVNRREIRPGSQVPRLHVKIAAQRLENTAAEFNLVGFIAPERQVGRAAAGSHTGRDGERSPQRGATGQSIEIGNIGGLELCAAGLGIGKPSKPIEHQLDHLLTAVGDKKIACF